MKARPITLFDDGDLSVARVPLARTGDLEAVVEHEVYKRLLTIGVSPNWQSFGGYVGGRTRNGWRLIGRILTNAKAGQRVRYLDGNPLNLRRSNLEVTQGGFSLRNDFEDLVSEMAL